MKKLLAFAFVCALVLTFAGTSVAEGENTVVEEEAVAVTESVVNPCDCYPAPAPCLLGSLFRRPCMPSYASPCNPCPVAVPCAPCPQRIFAPCNAAPYYSAPCAGYGYGFGNGYGPVRSLLARLIYGLRGGYAPVYGGGCYAEPGFGYGFPCYGAAPVVAE